MSKLIVAIILLAASVAAADDFVLRTVNLGVSGTLEDLRRNNPVHYGKVRQIIAGLHERYDVEKWIKTSFNATDVHYKPFLLFVTYPPKRHLSFTIDDTRYEAYITLANDLNL